MIKDIIKSNVFKMIAALTAVGVLSGAALVLIYTLTATQIKDNRNKKQKS